MGGPNPNAFAAGVPATGGTFTGPVNITGASATGGLLTVTNTTTVPSAPSVIITTAGSGDNALGVQVSGDTASRWKILSTPSQQFGNGTGTFDVNLTRPSAAVLGQSAGSFDVSSAGQGLRVSEGSNGKQGLATLVAGTVTVANTNVTANSRIFCTTQILGTVTSASTFDTPRTAGTSFTIHASQATDTSTVAWEIFEPG